jgi:hypothetical protein
VIILNTCLGCGRVFEAAVKRDFCNSSCRWMHASKKRRTTREVERARVRAGFFGNFIFEDVVL